MDREKNNEPEKSLTLRYLLENPALLQPPDSIEEEKCKEEKEKAFAQSKQSDLTSAYLGPQIWSDMLLSDDLKLEPVDLDELLDPSGNDDEMSDIGIMLQSSPSKSINHNEVQQCITDDPGLMTYQDMPQLMSNHTPVEAQKVPSPSDYFCLQNTPACPQQQPQMPTCSSFQMQLPQQPIMHSSMQQQHMNNGQAVPRNYKVMQQPQLDQRQFTTGPSPFSNGFDGTPALEPPRQLQPVPLYMEPQHPNPAKRPRHSSVGAPMQHPLSQSPYPPILPRQLSTNDSAYGPPPLMPNHSPPPLMPNHSPPGNGCLKNQTSPKSRTSPFSPVDVHIPSPKTVNYIPNSADICISTPQDANEGSSFDPSRRTFTEEELKPQPIIRKSKKVHVAADSKDGKYWCRRNKNNVAAKRSREARRIKENQIAMRASYLERENAALKTEVNELRKELTRAVDLVKKYEKRFSRIPN